MIPNKWLVWLLLQCGRRLFTITKTWAPDEQSEARVVTFASSERDYNIATRQHVEYLDEQ